MPRRWNGRNWGRCLLMPVGKRLHLRQRSSICSSGRASLKQHHILAEALNQNLGFLDLAKLTAHADAEKAGLVRLVQAPKQPLLADYATKDGLKRELWSVNLVNKTKNCFPALNPTFEPNRKLTPEQCNAVKTILNTPDQCCGVRGVAGAGKTTLQTEVHRGLSAAGHRVIAIAPTASAAETLRKEGFPTATTVAAFLQNPAQFDPHRAVVICDEAGPCNRTGMVRRCFGWRNKTKCG